VPPKDLAGEGGILNPANNVKILISTPKTAAGTREYESRIKELLDNYVTGDGQPFNGIPVEYHDYIKPTSSQQGQSWQKTYRGKVVVSYDPEGIADGSESVPEDIRAGHKGPVYRVWQENKMTEERWCNGQNQKRQNGGACPLPNSSKASSTATPTKTPTPSETPSPTETPTPTSTPQPEPEPSVEPRPNFTDNCNDATVFTSFSYGEADKAIKNFCYNVVEIGIQPTWKTYKKDGLHLHLAMGWSQSGQDGCHPIPPEDLNNNLPISDCESQFLANVNRCNTDTIEKKFGSNPMVWNSDQGCIDFYIAGHGDDWDCNGAGTVECSGTELPDDEDAPGWP
jgi:hypothetical protein